MRNLLTITLLLAAGALWAEELPVETFFKNPELAQVQLSPDGKHIGVVAPVGGRRNLVVLDAASYEPTVVTSLGEGQNDIASFTWVNNDRLVFFVDADGNESFSMYGIDRDGSRGRLLFEGAKGVTFAPSQVGILNILEDDPDEILVSSNEERKFYPDVYRMNVNTGRQKKEILNPGYVRAWLADHDGVVRIGISDLGEPGKLISRILYRSDDDSEWVSLGEFGWGEESWAPVAFTADNSKLYVLSNLGRDTAALYLYDPEEKAFGEMIFGHDEVDVADVALARDSKELIAAAYVTDAPRWHFVSDEWAALQAGIDQALPGTINRFSSMGGDDQRIVITAYNDRTPPSYYLLDRQARSLKSVGESRPWIDPDLMAEIRPVTYKARDGETIHGYLTLPPGKEAEDLPLIVNPHGGPYGVRDVWGFNPELQFLANRGYAVLQMNFRGSGGYGKRFVDIGYGRWGLEMQNDVTDGVKWAIDRGIADPDRVCIYGASYGGYATMAGLTMTPELYRCGVNYVGVVDLEMLYEWDARFDASRAWFEAAVGDPESDGERMRRTSPINLVESIDDPVFVVHGVRDPRVEIRQARVLIDALEEHGKTHEVMIKADEGHGFSKEANRIELYEAMDAFFRKYLAEGSASGSADAASAR
ncbi:MAG: S9 family peptidase [Gammaproteobacteria bacterium]